MVRSLAVVFGLIAVVGVAPGRAHEGDSHAGTHEGVPPHPRLPECQRDDPLLKLPDLVPQVPGSPRTFIRSSFRELQFTTAIGNIGDGPFKIEGITVSMPEGVFTAGYQLIQRRDGTECARPGGLFSFHDEHAHWHFDRFVGYELRRDDPYTGELVAGGDKASFCLLDIQLLRGYSGLDFPRQVMTQTCNRAEGIVGISVGWEDIYERFLPGQSINLDPDRDHQVPVGTYFLANVVNPDGDIWEKNTANNTSFVETNVLLSPNLASFPPTLRPGPSPARTLRPNQRPRIRVRPPRATRPPRPGSTIARPPIEPTPTVDHSTRPEPTPTPRVNRGPRQLPTRNGRPPRPTRAPRPGRPGADVPTPTPQPIAGVPDRCRHTCPYDSSQLRLTWYTALGLQFNGFINPGGAGCEPLHPEPGAEGTLYMVNWRNQPGVNLNFDRSVSFVLGEDQSGLTSDSGEMSFNQTTGGFRFQYESPVQPIANQASGFDRFPVVFDVCLVLGNETVTTRLVCQPKSRGMLCHEG